ncbi:hypothetical protein QBC42DRAFT_300432 [Cladorrhinum samala]|uniref:Uncharacterized protein n=1 Tax=Cladorrhinum samala TaxID=585594 RepID=A0AAV9HFP2_9PEZI|nr:hypothetical protein QBC42DRAFT_300432 [Cladorrhinum samala]
MLGLWEEQLALHLYWNIGQSLMNPRRIPCTTVPVPSDFPSWSWLSVVPNHTNGCNFSRPLDFGHSGLTESVRLVEFLASWEGPAYTSRLRHSRLRVSALTKHATITTVPGGNKCRRMPRCHWDRNGVPSLGAGWECFLQYEYPPNTRLSVLLLQLYQTASTYPGMSLSGDIFDRFLILMEDGASGFADRYYRIGVGRAVTADDQEPVFLNSERGIIELV